jgi:CubicO group peptidase (beta-lactamase class C family)
MHRRNTLLLSSILLLASCRAEPTHPGNSIGIAKYPGVRDLYRFAEEQRAKHEWPALGVGIIHKGKIVGLGMAGERKRNSGNWAALDDRFDVGSCAKSMTAAAAAMLVEEGKLQWDTRIIDVFPEWQKIMLPAYTNVTLEQLIGHRSGLDQWMKSNLLWSDWHRQHSDRSATEKRALFATAALRREPRYPPGTDHYYCNDGYLVAGSMIEKASGHPFEDFARQRLFEPLELKSPRFGHGAENENDSSVWGHEARSFGRTRAVRPDSAEYGDPPFGSPGGFLYCSVPDLLRYVNFQMQGANGQGRLLKPESFERLFTPREGISYGNALGWHVEIKRDSDGKIVERSIYHGGYSGRFRANMWFCPETEWGTVIICNHGRGDGAEMSAVFFALLKEVRLVD